MFSGISSQKNKRIRKHPTRDRTKFGRRFTLELLEDRRLLSVNLGNATASSWSYGQAATISAVVVDAATKAAPAANTEVDLVNCATATATSAPILVKGATDASGNVVFDLTTLNVGAYNLMAEFSDSAGACETSSAVPVTVTVAATTTTLASSDPAPVYGEKLTITATVAPGEGGAGTPTGSVVFTIDGNASQTFTEKLDGSGVATLIIPNSPIPPMTGAANPLPVAPGLKVGHHTITAIYQGDADFSPSPATPLPLTVCQAATTTTLTSSADGVASVPFGQPVVFKAAVQVVSPGTGIPSGFVSFVDTSTTPATVLGKAYVTLSAKTAAANTGVASFVDATLPVGTHTIVAYYQGDHNYLPSDTSKAVPPETVTVTASASTTVAWAAPNPAVFGAPVTLSAVVLPGYLGPMPSPAATAAGLPGPVGPPIFLGLTGSVQFRDNGDNLGAPVPLVYGKAQLTVPHVDPTGGNSIAPLPVGTDAITAVYIPDAASKFGGSTSKVFNEVIVPTLPPVPVKTTTTVTPQYQQIPSGLPVSFSITVSPAVPGTDTVTVYDISSPPPGTPPGPVTPVPPVTKTLLGTATYDAADSCWDFTTTKPLGVGYHIIDALFGGDANFTSSEGCASVQVTGPSPLPPSPLPPLGPQPLAASVSTSLAALVR